MKLKTFLIMTACCLVLVSCASPAREVASTPTTISTSSIQRFPTSTPTITPTPVPTPGDTLYQLDGISFIVPECMVLRPSIETVPAVRPDPDAGPLMVYPEHRQVTFGSYPLEDKYFEPLLRVFPVEEFTAMSEQSASSVTRMQELLELQALAEGDSIPLLPGHNMGQVFKAQVRFLNFENGSGVRWLTELAQYSAAMNNRDLFYSYQGLTNDGKYWVSIMLPVNAAYLQETWDSTEVPPGGLSHPAAGSPGMDEALEEYYRLMLILLNNTPDAGFTPALNCLDGLVASITISQ
jgi:hypothetical protein